MKARKTMLVEQHYRHDDDEDKYPYVYVVKKVTNSTQVKISQTLTQTELQDYCDREDWDVTIT